MARFAILIGASLFGPGHWFGGIPNVRRYFAVSAVVCISQVLESVVINFIRAMQLSVLLMVYQVVKRYVMLGLVVGGVLFVARSLTTYYAAMLFSEVAAAVLSDNYISPSRCS